MGIDLSVAERCQKIQRLFGYLFLRSRFCRFLDNTAVCDFFSDYIPQHLFEGVPLFLGQDCAYQKIFALICRHLLKISPSFPVIRDAQLRPENVLRALHPSLTAP